MENHVPTRVLIMLVLYNSQVFHRTSYSRMSLGYMRGQLSKYHDRIVTLSTVKYHLAKIKSLKLMKFYKNNCGRREDGTVFRRPSNRAYTVKGLKFLAACGVTVARWLWDVVTGKVKLPRKPGAGYYEKQQLAAREAVDAPNGVRKLISKIGKNFGGLKLFT